MLFLFAFVLGGFPLSDVVLNFISLHPVVPGYIAFIWTKFVPFDRDLGCFNQDPGLHINATAKITVNYLQAEIPVHRGAPVHRDHINRPNSAQK